MYEYRINEEGNYELTDASDGEVLRTMPEVALALDKSEATGILFKHGDPQRVQAWARTHQQALAAAGHTDLAEDVVVITGRFPPEEINKCLDIAGYVVRFYRRLVAGEIEMAPESVR